MIAPLDQQLIGRYVEVLQAHKDMPTNTAPVCESMTESAVALAMDGQLTHIMYIKDDKLLVGWMDSVHFQWLFDAWGTSPMDQH